MIPAADTRLADLSLGELLAALRTQTQPEPAQAAAPAREYGIEGIRRIFHCGKTQANRIKQSGVIDDAIIQVGKLIIIDTNKALELWKGLKQKPVYKY